MGAMHAHLETSWLALVAIIEMRSVAQVAVHNAHVGDNCAVGVVPRVEDQPGLGRPDRHLGGHPAMMMSSSSATPRRRSPVFVRFAADQVGELLGELLRLGVA